MCNFSKKCTFILFASGQRDSGKIARLGKRERDGTCPEVNAAAVHDVCSIALIDRAS